MSFSDMGMNEESSDYIPKRVIMCEFQVEAVNNWMIGYHKIKLQCSQIKQCSMFQIMGSD